MFYGSEKEKKYVVFIEWHEKTVSGEKLVDGQRQRGKPAFQDVLLLYLLSSWKDIYVSY